MFFVPICIAFSHATNYYLQHCSSPLTVVVKTLEELNTVVTSLAWKCEI